jgi:nucleotide-binding universal stress UspA family protein
MTSVMFKAEPGQTAEPRSDQAGMKSVLLHVQDDKGLEARLQTALAIVRASGGHLTCVFTTPFSTYAGFETYGGAYVQAELFKQLEEQEAAMKARIEDGLANEDVAWSYEHQSLDPASVLVKWGALADLILLGRQDPTPASAYRSSLIFGALLASSHTPMLICPNDAERFDPFGTAAIAWNGSFEAANALRAALPLLKQAAAVHIVAIDEDKDFDFPPLGASVYLSRHGIHAELIRESKGTHSVDERLVASARSLGASYLVMGAYGHSRAREYLFGGVTRSLLKDCPIPLLLSR